MIKQKNIENRSVAFQKGTNVCSVLSHNVPFILSCITNNGCKADNVAELKKIFFITTSSPLPLCWRLSLSSSKF